MAHDSIVAEELTCWYGESVAVDHISFNVAKGEILGFLGPNGLLPIMIPLLTSLPQSK